MAIQMLTVFSEVWPGGTLQVWILIWWPILILFSMMKDITTVARLTPVSTGAAIMSCLIIDVKSMIDSNVWADWPKIEPTCFKENPVHQSMPQDFTSLGATISILFAAFAVVPNVPNILCSMKEPKDFPSANRASVAIVTCLYLSIMLLGHWGYGTFIDQSSVANSMALAPLSCKEAYYYPREKWCGTPHPLIGMSLAILVSINLLITIPLIQCSLFNSIVGLSPRLLRRGRWPNRLMRVATVCLCIFIASIGGDDFLNMFGLFMSICTPVLCVWCPIFFAQSIRRKANKGSGWLTMILQGFFVIFALFACVFGTMDAISGFKPKPPDTVVPVPDCNVSVP